MYPIVLLIHSWLRWSALIAAVGAMMAAWRNHGTDRWALALVAVLDLQLLIGLVLYLVLSPYTAGVRSNVEVVMRDPTLRFWNVEHAGLMLASVVAAHLGRVLSRRAPTPGSKRTRLLICFGLATLLMVAGIPWPGLDRARPLFRWDV